MKRINVFCLILWVLVPLCASSLFGAVPQIVNYQGRLTTSVGSPVSDTVNMVFTICADSLCTTQLWTESHNNVIVSGGLFDALLGSITPIPGVVFDGSVRFLSISMDGTPVTRRLAVVSVGYAFKAINADTANYAKASGGDIDCSDCDDRFVNASGPDSVHVKVGTAFLGKAVGNPASLLQGVEGYASNTGDGSAVGGYFHTSDAGAGIHIGVEGDGLAASTEEVYGVYGMGMNTSGGNAYGGYFTATTHGTGVHIGLSSKSYSSTPSGSYAISATGSNTSSGVACGGSFTTSADGTGTHYGVNITSNGSSSSTTYGIRSEADNTSTGTAYGGYFRVPSSGTGTHYALRGLSYGGSSNDTYGSYIYAQNTSTGDVLGGYFEVGQYGSGSHTAVCGKAYHSDASSPSIGVYGYAENSGEGNAYAGYFSAPGRDDGVDYAIYASAPIDTGSVTYAGWFDGFVVASGGLRVEGNLTVVGFKSAVVQTSEGQYRTVYCQESPENWFEDFGEGQLQNGRTHIELDPVFLETVTIDAQHPMKVFVQLEGDCNGVYVEKGTTGFNVSELKGGSSSASFSYRVVAKRKGYEDLRLAKLEGFAPEKMRTAGQRMEAEMAKDRAGMQAEDKKQEAEMSSVKKAPAETDQE